MFKALGRWGSQVRSSIRIPFFSSLFGSKSKKYGDLDEEEEIFVDAEEDFIHEPEIGDKVDHTPIILETHPTDTDVRNDATENQFVATKDTCDNKDNIDNKQISPDITITVTTHEHEREANELGDKEERNIDSDDKGEESEVEEHDEDDHHVNHKDTKKMMQTSKSSNGLQQSSSSSVFQKVHRRVNSYTQRQYAKFDNAQDDHNDNFIKHEEITEAACDVADNNNDGIFIKTEKKSKKRKKVAFFAIFRGLFKFRTGSSSSKN